MPKDLAGERLGQARGIGTLGAKQVRLTDAIGRGDKSDLYTFSLGNRSRLNLDVTVASANAGVGVQVLKLKDNRPAMLKAIGRMDFSKLKPKDTQRFFTPVAGMQFDRKGDDRMQVNLDAGEYYVRVVQRKGNTAYSMTLDAAPESSSNAPPKSSTKSPTKTPTQSPTKATPVQPPAPPPRPIDQPTLIQVSPTLIRQFGGTDNDYAYGTATDQAGNLYLTGVNSLTKNSFVAAYNTNGEQLWQREVNLPGTDTLYDVEVDSNGNYYVAGMMNITAKGSDGIVMKYDSTGQELWREEIVGVALGTTSIADAASSLVLDSANNVYVTGFLGIAPTATTAQLGNAFVAKLDGQTGDRVSSFGQKGIVEIGGDKADASGGIAIDSNGTLYIAGITNANLALNPSRPFAEGDAFVSALSSTTGAQIWSQTLAGDTGQDYARAIAVDGQGNVYVTGQTSGTLPSGSLAANKRAGTGTDMDAFLAKYGTDGSLKWVKQFGTTSLDESQAIAVDSAGKIYVTGETKKALFGNAVGGSDAWMAQYNGDGTLLVASQVGTAKDDETYGISVDSSGNIYIAGQTVGAFAGATNQGKYDAWIAKYAPLT